MKTNVTRKERAFKNMFVDSKNLNNVCGIPNTPIGRGTPKKAVVPTAPGKKKK